MRIRHIGTYQCDKYKEFIKRTNQAIRTNEEAQFRLGYCMEIDLKEIK